MTAAPKREHDPGGLSKHRRPLQPLPKSLVKVAAVCIIPWTMASLLSPFGEPRLFILALPVFALVTLIVAVRARIMSRRAWIPWVFTVLLSLSSGVRFLVFPFFSEITTSRAGMDESGEALLRVLLTLGGVKAVFYLGAAGLLIYSGTMLALRHARGEKSGD